MQARMKNPALTNPDALNALMALKKATSARVPMKTLHLVHLRASQINGCAICVDMHVKVAKKEGESDQRLHGVAAWREMPFFSPPERAALALTEAATRLADQSDPVPDAVWNEAANHYDEGAMSDLVMNIAMINFWNRLNATTRQIVDPESKW